MLEASAQEQEIRHQTARARQVKDPGARRKAAFKAWRTMRAMNRAKAAKGSANLLLFSDEIMALPPGVVSGHYVLNPPLIKESKLTYVEKGGVGKQLSDGWVINFAIGCTFGCKFCYVDEIHKKFGFRRAGSLVYNDWGYYFAVPSNMKEVIDATDWSKWKGEEVMLSSTHDPYLPQLRKWTRKVLEVALPAGVKFCVQTRSPLVERDFDILHDYKKQVRIQVSVATLNPAFSRAVETRVVDPERRIAILRAAKAAGLRTGVIMAPIFPSVPQRKNVRADLEAMALELSKIRPDHIYGESIHVRGINLAYVENAIGEKLELLGFDGKAEAMFHQVLGEYGLSGIWWPEH
jgi:DNA repair photolyase